MSTHYTGPQFEDEVRNIARNLFSNSIGQGSQMVDGRERDGVFWNGEFYTVIEATTDRKKDKAERDAKKTHELVAKLRKDGDMARGYFVTLDEPTVDQKDAVKKYSKTLKIISFDELRSLLFDAQLYLNNRVNRRFGSVYDHVKHRHDVPRDAFIEPSLTLVGGGEAIDINGLFSDVKVGGRSIVVAEYGVGKSMVLREIFFKLLGEFRAKNYFRTPIAINLRDHLGQSDPVELLERHARQNASDPQKLVAAWNAGYVDLLIDGFDELSTRGWTGNIKRLREYRRSAHAVVRRLIKDSPKSIGIIIAGRDAYFDSHAEMREALGAPMSAFKMCRIHPFDEVQVQSFLHRRNFKGDIPDWIPTRPLLLTYLVSKGLLQAALDADASGNFPKGSAWLSLIDMIADREAEQSDGVDKASLLEFLGALSVVARQSSNSDVSFSPQRMEEIFISATGASILEDERNILMRLPGLGAAQDDSNNRSFIDLDFMNVCCSIPSLAFVQSPFAENFSNSNFSLMTSPLSEVGVEAIATLCERSKIVHGVANTAIGRAISDGSVQLAHDLFSASTKLFDLKDYYTFEGIELREVDLTSDTYDGLNVDYSECLLDSVILPRAEDNNAGITFTNCLIGSLEGRTNAGDLSENQFIDCEVSSFSDDYSVNSEVLDASMPLGLRVLVVTLRKLFTQYGASRLESALVRGMDHRARMIVPDVIELLQRHGYIVPTGRQGKVTYSGTKSKRSEAMSIIQAPNKTDLDIVRDCSRLS
ncbi:NACHT domain-containing protein [Pseudooceanicola nitratireducens]|uniref:NACHT domain-containing protein n=1 Tax=Pseudooceanicola nitratireducens TaxID=517719 RepID=UPI001C94146E|nr:NACHT domain-containing protein [Pseudooceanicola nitratireducens]MBY6164619.1 NACHT domain-containing protein [Pseudooceanicola nitratireducens]